MKLLRAPLLAQLPLTAALGCMAPGALAQCAEWRVGASLPGIDGFVSEMLAWDPPGATPARLVIAGSFRAAGATLVSNLALFDPVARTFAALGAGVNGPVSDIAIEPGTNNLIVGGQFTSAGGVAGTAGVARHDGTSWSSIGGGLPGSRVISVAASVNGVIFASGDLSAPSVAALAAFNGTTWTVPAAGTPRAPNSPPTNLGTDAAGRVLGIYTDVTTTGAPTVVFNGNASLTAFTELGRGSPISSLLVRGSVAFIGGLFSGLALPGGGSSPVVVFASRVTDGSQPWAQVPLNGLTGLDAGISSLSLLPNNDILLGGNIALGTSTGVARLPANGTPIQPLLGGVAGFVSTGASLPGSTNVFVAGSFDGVINGATTPAAGFAEFTGAGWATIGTNAGLFADQSSPPSVDALAVLALQPFGGGVAAGGRFEQAAGAVVNNVALWRGAWTRLGNGFDGPVQALLAADGSLFAGGLFTNSGGGAVNRIAQWTGTTWRRLGSGIGGAGATEVRALARAANGDIIVGGIFTTAGGVPCGNVARWEVATQSWRALGSGVLGRVSALAVLPNGSILAGGDFVVAGQPVALQQFDGANWRNISRLNGSVNALLVEPAGTVLVGGTFTTDGATTLNRIARWNGASMSALGGGVSGVGASVGSITRMANGDVVVGGSFTSASSARATNIARFDGTRWSEFGLGTDAAVQAVVNIDDLSVGVGGRFGRAGDSVRSRFATLVSVCRPAISSYTAPGCQSLVANNSPLVGATFRATASGVPAGALAIGAVGVSQVSIPFAVPGATCTQLVSLDILDVFVPTSSMVSVSFAINNSPTLLGAVLHYQVQYPTFGAGGAITAIAATNALRLTVGSF